MTRNIDLSTADLKDITAWYNENSGTKPKKFSDIVAARTQAEELYVALQELESGNSKGKKKEKKPAAKKGAKKESKNVVEVRTGGKAAKKEKAEKAAEGTPGKRSRNAGKTIKRAINAETGKPIDNPRREGTHGHRSFELIDPKKGIKYEDYLAAGGRNNDLGWDIDHGFVTVED